jgi:hypothetical protein
MSAYDDDDDGGQMQVNPVDKQQERLYAGWTGSPYTKQASHKLNDKVLVMTMFLVHLLGTSS